MMNYSCTRLLILSVNFVFIISLPFHQPITRTICQSVSIANERKERMQIHTEKNTLDSEPISQQNVLLLAVDDDDVNDADASDDDDDESGYTAGRYMNNRSIGCFFFFVLCVFVNGVVRIRYLEN